MEKKKRSYKYPMQMESCQSRGKGNDRYFLLLSPKISTLCPLDTQSICSTMQQKQQDVSFACLVGE